MTSTLPVPSDSLGLTVKPQHDHYENLTRQEGGGGGGRDGRGREGRRGSDNANPYQESVNARRSVD